MDKKKYSIAVSYASEQRPYVERFVRRLQSLNLHIYYDRNEQAHMAGKILDQELHKIYIKQSKHCVLFLSNEYIGKPVTRYESQIILSETIFKDGFMYIFKFDNVTLPGLNRNFVYSSVKEYPEPEQYADFMYEIIQGKKPENVSEELLCVLLSDSLSGILEHLSRQYELGFRTERQTNKVLFQLQSDDSTLLQLQIGNLPGKIGVCLWLHRGRCACDKYAYQGYVQWCARDCCYLLENRGILSELTPELTFSSLDEFVNRLEAEIQWLIGK